MARRLQWCTVVLLLALLFVTTNGLRGPSSQVEGQETRTPSRGRGVSRFNPKVSEGLETSTLPFSSTISGSPSRTRNGRRGGSSRTEDTSKHGIIETTTLRSARQEQDVKLSAANGRRSNNSPVSTASPERRRFSSGSRKSSTSSPTSETTVVGLSAEVKKTRTDEPDSGTDIRKDVKQESRRVGLFRARKGSSSRKVIASATTELTSVPMIEDFTNRKIDLTGPSVFSGTTEISRSRTGRKIQTTLSSRDLKIGLPTSGRFGNSRQKSQKHVIQERNETPTPRRDSLAFERRSDDFSTRNRHDIVPAGSESVRIDVPLIVELKTTSRLDNSLSSLSSASDDNSVGRDRRRRARGRSGDEATSEITTTAASRSSRRGSSRFVDEKAENIPEKNMESRNVPKRSRISETQSRNHDKSSESRTRKRGRSQESMARKTPDVSGRGELLGKSSLAPGSFERRGRLSAARSSATDVKSSEPEVRTTRSRFKGTSVATLASPATTRVSQEETTVALTTAESATASSRVFPSLSASTTVSRSGKNHESTESTIEPRSRNRVRTTVASTTITKSPREDYFNHGVGFRGRKFVNEAATTKKIPDFQNTSSTEVPTRGNSGRTLKRRPGNHQEDIVTSSSSPITISTLPSKATAISNEIPTSNEAFESTTSSLLENALKSRGTKRPVIGTDKNSEGGKTFSKSSGRDKANGEPNESDNYPADFKARIAQLKNAKAKDATAKPGLGGLFKKTNDPQYVARSRKKLESATKLVLEREPINDDTVTKVSSVKKFDAKRRSSNVTATAKIAEDRKTSKLTKRFKSSEVTTTASIERKFSRLSKARKNDENMETTRLGQLEQDNNLIEMTTIPYSRIRQEAGKNDSSVPKTQPAKPWILSRKAKELPRENISTTTRRTRAWIAPHIDKNFQESSRLKKTEDTSTRRSVLLTTTTKKSRVWNTAYIDRNWQEPGRKSLTNVESFTEKTGSTTGRANSEIKLTVLPSETSEKIVDNDSPSSRYMRKKSEIFKPFEPVPKIGTTEKISETSRRRDFRPRTATYRRHSEAPQLMVVNALPAEKSSSSSIGSIAITPKVPLKFHATLRESSSSPTQRSARQEPALNVKISSDNDAANKSNVSSGIVGISNGDSGNSGSNIFNPTRSTFLLSSNATFLEQLRSTVAPLLGALGNRTPIFAGAYSDVKNSDLGKRITPSGSPPRFSARYKGAELFVRRPNVLEPAGLFLTSSTTPFTPTEVLTIIKMPDEDTDTIKKFDLLDLLRIIWADDPTDTDKTTGTFTANVLGTNDLR